MKLNITRTILAVVLALSIFNVPALAQGTKLVSGDCACEALPRKPAKPPVVTGISIGMQQIPLMYVGGSPTVLYPQVTWSNRRLTPDYTAASSDPSVVQVAVDSSTGALTLTPGSKPGTPTITLTPAKDPSKAQAYTATVKDVPVKEVKVPVAGASPFPWGWLIFAILLALLVGALLTWLFARRRNQQELDEATDQGRRQAEQNYRQQIAEANRDRDVAQQALRQSEIDLLRERTQRQVMIDEAVAAMRARVEEVEGQLNTLRPIIAQYQQIAREQGRLAEIQLRLANQADGILNPPAPAV
jgi:hypothetical protein